VLHVSIRRSHHQFLIEFDPAKLTQIQHLISQITQAINPTTQTPARIMDRGQQGFVVRGVGLIGGLDDLGTSSSPRERRPVLIKDLAT